MTWYCMCWAAHDTPVPALSFCAVEPGNSPSAHPRVAVSCVSTRDYLSRSNLHSNVQFFSIKGNNSSNMWPNNILKALYLFRTSALPEKSIFRTIKHTECISNPSLMPPFPHCGKSILLTPGCLSDSPRQLLAFELLCSFDIPFLAGPERRMEIYGEGQKSLVWPSLTAIQSSFAILKQRY